MNRRIVLGVDGSTSALRAARWAADEAARRQLPLLLAHGVHLAAIDSTANYSPPQKFFDDLESEGRAQLDAARAVIGQAHPEVAVEFDLRTAEPVPTLIEDSDGAELVVLGSRGLGGFTGMLVGSTAIAVTQHAHCPVAIVHGPDSDQAPVFRGPVVIGVDGSPTGEAALALAFEEASWRGAELVAVHTWLEFSADRTFAYPPALIAARGELETEARETLAERLAGWQEKYPDVAVRRVVAMDRPVRRLLAEAAEAQLLVVGSRGRGGFTGMLLGSTSQALVYHAPCPLLVVRPSPAS